MGSLGDWDANELIVLLENCVEECQTDLEKSAFDQQAHTSCFTPYSKVQLPSNALNGGQRDI